jgi:hypothetical protein
MDGEFVASERFVVDGDPAGGYGGHDGPGCRDVVWGRRGADNTPTPVGVTEMSRGSSEANTPGWRPPGWTCTPRGVRERAAHGRDVGLTGPVGHATLTSGFDRIKNFVSRAGTNRQRNPALSGIVACQRT